MKSTSRNTGRFVGMSAMALAVAAMPALAFADMTGVDAVDERIGDISETAQTDLARAEDASRFGNPEGRDGMSGSASLSYSGKTGNSESQEFSTGARLRYADGPFVHNLGFALDFADTAGVKTKEDILAVYDGNYYFNDKVYGFVLGRLEMDGLASAAGQVATDGYIGVGPGYRVVNTDQMAWRVQAGVGLSHLKDGAGVTTDETGYIASSRFFYKINDGMFATMDTDILNSNSALRVNNEIGLSMKVTEAFATRVSYTTEFNDSRAIRSDNKLGLSLVYGF